MSVSRIVDIELTVPRRPDETGPLPAPSKPPPIVVSPEGRLGELIEAALQQCQGHLLANRRAARSIDDPEGVHQLRVSVRRARSALALFGGSLARKPARQLRGELRWLGGALGPARDWDVFCRQTLAEVRGELPDAPGLRRLCWEAELQRLTAHRAAVRALDSDRFAYLVLRLDRYVRGGEWAEDLGRKAKRRLQRPARKAAARLLDDLFADVRVVDRPVSQLESDQLHALRIRGKRLRYGIEFLAPVHPGKASRRFATRLKVLQDVLGRMNDGRVADTLLDSLLGRLEDEDLEAATREHVARAAGLVSGWSHRRWVHERREVEQAWLAVAGSAAFWR